MGWIETPRILTLSVHLDMPSKDAIVIEVNCDRVHQKSESWMQVGRCFFYPQSSGKNPRNHVLMTSVLCNLLS